MITAEEGAAIISTKGRLLKYTTRKRKRNYFQTKMNVFLAVICGFIGYSVASLTTELSLTIINGMIVAYLSRMSLDNNLL